jgi:non-heme chloroperoxidase
VGLRYFEPQLTGLSDEYRCLAFDFRGHGRSAKTELGYMLARYARDVRVFLDRLNLDDVVVVGWSMGAIVS